MHAVSEVGGERPEGVGDLPGHHDLGPAEQRSRCPRAARLRDLARCQFHRRGRDVSGAAQGRDAGSYRDLSRHAGSSGSSATGSSWPPRSPGRDAASTGSAAENSRSTPGTSRRPSMPACVGSRRTTSISTRSTGRTGTSPAFGQLFYDPAKERPTVPIEEQLEALGAMVKAGKVRYIGLSNETPWGTLEFLRTAERLDLPRAVSIQNAYNLINRTFESGLSEVSRKENIGLLAYSPLAFGHLSGKYLDGAKPAGARLTVFPPFGQRYDKPNVPLRDRRLCRTGAGARPDAGNVSARFCPQSLVRVEQHRRRDQPRAIAGEHRLGRRHACRRQFWRPSTPSTCVSRIPWSEPRVSDAVFRGKRLTGQGHLQIIAGFVGGVPERSKGSDCKSDGSAFEGSNPSPSTRDSRRKAGSTSCREWAERGGCSSMVEQKPSKLTTRVRFPSPAP